MSQIALVSSKEVREALAREPGRSCGGRDTCLVGLANAVGATYAILVTVTPDAARASLYAASAGARHVLALEPEAAGSSEGAAAPGWAAAGFSS